MFESKKKGALRFPEYVKISGNGVLHVDVERLMKTPAVKRQLEAVQRIARGEPLARRRKIV